MQQGQPRRTLVPGYSQDDQPLGSYLLFDALFVAAFGGGLIKAARSSVLPADVSVRDVVLAGIATHKVSRLVTKSNVASVLRAPFSTFEGPGDLNEVNEEPRGAGLRRAIGELLACPLCLGAWVAGGFMSGLVRAPRSTRVVAGGFAALTVADLMHVAYAAALQRAE